MTHEEWMKKETKGFKGIPYIVLVDEVEAERFNAIRELTGKQMVKAGNEYAERYMIPVKGVQVVRA